MCPTGHEALRTGSFTDPTNGYFLKGDRWERGSLRTAARATVVCQELSRQESRLSYDPGGTIGGSQRQLIVNIARLQCVKVFSLFVFEKHYVASRRKILRVSNFALVSFGEFALICAIHGVCQIRCPDYEFVMWLAVSELVSLSLNSHPLAASLVSLYEDGNINRFTFKSYESHGCAPGFMCLPAGPDIALYLGNCSSVLSLWHTPFQKEWSYAVAASGANVSRDDLSLGR